MPYKLSATLAGHTADVRAVASPTANLVLSASRDTTANAWNRSAPGSHFQATKFQAGSRYVNAVAYLPHAEPTHPGYLVAGGQDAIINVFSLAATKEDPDYSCVGHTDNVCALHTTSNGIVISGSWDKTARVWKDFQILYTLRGHQQAVWAVLAIDSTNFLTASADKTIKLWNEHKEIRTYTGHTDAVRGLALVPDIGFASCANDSEIRVWTTGGDLVYTLSGHTSFIYSLSVLPTGEIVSAGEDRSVRVWRDGECWQTIVHPAISVWAVSTMPNGDIVSGTSDGIVRVFSNVEERWAAAEEIQQYEGQVSSQSLNKEQVGDLKQSDIKTPEALQQPGHKDGQVLLVRDGQSVDAYQWDSSSHKWLKAGQVVDAVGSSRKQLHEGKEYDYVFDVDIQEGLPPLKLPYNASENPFQAAQRFLNAHDLPLTYVDEVVNFIEKNTAGVTLGTSNEYIDPYTGSSRYRSSGDPAPSSGGTSSAFIDPFTGASRYSGATQPVPPPVQPAAPKILPLTAPVIFKQANVPAMRNKAYQINDALRIEISTFALAISPNEMYSLDQVFDYLTSVTALTKDPIPPCLLNSSHVNTIVQILERWPPSQRFPVIDLARLMSAYVPTAYGGPGQGLSYLNSLFDAAEWSQPWEQPLPKTRETNTLLALRGIANAFQIAETSDVAFDWVQPILEKLLQAPCASFTTNQRIAMATIAFNISCLSLNGGIDPEVRRLHLKIITNLLPLEENDPETVYRSLAALGNFLYVTKNSGPSIDVYVVQELRSLVIPLVSKYPEERIKNIGQEIALL